MLLIQDIALSWNKNERSSIYAKKRTEFSTAYPLDKLPDSICGDILVHRLKFLQKGTIFQTLQINSIYRFQCYSSAQELNLANLSVQPEVDGYKVTFFYDERRSGRPVRRGHNKDYNNKDSSLYRHDILNETAFFLKPGQYGQLLWNERKIDYDTGEWYYQLHVVNLLYYLGKMPETDIFLTRKPDFEYKQMTVLY